MEAALEIYEGDMIINTPYLRSGSLLDSSDTRGCLMEEQFAQAHGLAPGGTVTLTGSNAKPLLSMTCAHGAPKLRAVSSNRTSKGASFEHRNESAYVP